MNKAEVLENGYWIEISIDAYAQKVKGISRDEYPPLRCISCEKPVHDSGLVTPNPDYSPRFSHSASPENKEFRPLSARSQRFSGFSGNERSASAEIAVSRRNQFMQFDNLYRAGLFVEH